MNGDSDRMAKARHLVEDRERRYQIFPATLFDEHPWDMLLHLFIALFENETMEEARLIELVHATSETGRRWLEYLVKAEHLMARNDGDGVVLTEDAVSRMRAYLEPVERTIESER